MYVRNLKLRKLWNSGLRELEMKELICGRSPKSLTNPTPTKKKKKKLSKSLELVINTLFGKRVYVVITKDFKKIT